MKKAVVSKYLSIYYMTLKNLNIFFIISIFILVSYQILSRQITFLKVYLWTEELSRFLLIWTVFIGACVGVSDSDHFVINVFEGYLCKHPTIKYLQTLIKEIIILIFTIYLLMYGWIFMKSGVNRTSLSLDVSLIWVYGAYFVGGLSMFFFQIHRVILLVIETNTNKKRGTLC